jgi:hypothetical protein
MSPKSKRSRSGISRLPLNQTGIEAIIRLRNSSDEVFSYHIRSTDPLSKVQKLYAKAVGVSESSWIRLAVDSRTINPDHTPHQIGVLVQREIDVSIDAPDDLYGHAGDSDAANGKLCFGFRMAERKTQSVHALEKTQAISDAMVAYCATSGIDKAKAVFKVEGNTLPGNTTAEQYFHDNEYDSDETVVVDVYVKKG